MPLVDISLLEGRTQDKKEELMREVTDAVMRVLGSPPESVGVILRDVPATQWSKGGETLASIKSKTAS